MGGQLFAAALAELRNLASSARRALPYAPFDPVPVATKALDSHPQLKGRNTPSATSCNRRPRRHDCFSGSLTARPEEIGCEKGVEPCAIEVWFADEARIGQKNKIIRRWTKRGTRPSAPKDQRTASAYIFGAICPKDGEGAALVMPRCDTEAMNLHLAEIATQIAPARTPRFWSIRRGRISPPAWSSTAISR